MTNMIIHKVVFYQQTMGTMNGNRSVKGSMNTAVFNKLPITIGG